MLSLMTAATLAMSPCATPEETAAVTEKIEAANAEAVAALEAGDHAAYAGHFAEDAWQMPPNMPVLKGREAIAGFWEEANAMAEQQFELTTLDVSVCGPHAVERGAYTFTMTPREGAPEGMPTVKDSGHYLVHWKKIGEDWLIYSDAPVSTGPAAMPGTE